MQEAVEIDLAEEELSLECDRCHARVKKLVCNGLRSICEECETEIYGALRKVRS